MIQLQATTRLSEGLADEHNESEAKPNGETLRAAIMNCDLTLPQLAGESGVDKGALSRFVRQQRSLTLRSVDRLANRLGLLLKAE